MDQVEADLLDAIMEEARDCEPVTMRSPASHTVSSRPILVSMEEITFG